MGKTGRTKTNRKKKQELHVLHNQQCCANHSVWLWATRVWMFQNYIINYTINYMCLISANCLHECSNNWGLLHWQFEATITPQINHFICKVRKNKCSVQTVHSFEQFLVILYKTTSEHEINTSQFDDNSLLIFILLN